LMLQLPVLNTLFATANIPSAVLGPPERLDLRMVMFITV